MGLYALILSLSKDEGSGVAAHPSRRPLHGLLRMRCATRRENASP